MKKTTTIINGSDNKETNKETKTWIYWKNENLCDPQNNFIAVILDLITTKGN